MIKKIALVLLLLLFTSISVVFARPSDLEIIHGNIKLVVNQKTGAYFVYSVEDLQFGKYEPLFSDKRFGTSFLRIRADGQDYSVTKNRDFKVSCEFLPEEDDSVIVSYISDFMDVIQCISFLYDTNLDDSYAIKVEWKITSKLEVTEKFSVKYVLDTNLGEQFVPFYTDQSPEIVKEQQLTWPYRDIYVVSPGTKNALMLMLQGEFVTTPSKVVFSNWQRLFDSGWSYDMVLGRSFSLLPYSVDDSAICLYWSTEYVDPNESLSISLVLGPYREGGLVSLQDSVQNVVKPTVKVAAPVLLPESNLSKPVLAEPILAEPVTVDSQNAPLDSQYQIEILAIIDRIDYLMLHPEEAEEYEMVNLEQRLLDLQNNVNKPQD